MAEESEASIQDYARYYGLAQDHKVADLLETISCLEEISFLHSREHLSGVVKGPQEPYECSSCQPLHQDEHLPCVNCTDAWFKSFEAGITMERMFIDASTASMLAWVTQSSHVPPRFNDDDNLADLRSRRLKQALPVLRSDHDCDVQDFLQPSAPALRDEFLPFEILDEEADEGLTWPSKYFELPDKVWEVLSKERLAISAETLQYVSEIAPSGVCKTSFETDNESEPPVRKRMTEPMTPPLLPVSPTYMPYIPSSEAGHLDLLSDHSSGTKEQLLKIEHQVFAQDAIKSMIKASASSPHSSEPMLLDSDSIGDIYSALKGVRDPPSSPPDDRVSSQYYKVEVPLVVCETLDKARLNRKSISFTASVTEIIPDLPTVLPESEHDTMFDEIENFFDQTIRPVALKAERSIEQEQLQEADTTRRVSVPIMDFSLPVAPWNFSFQRLSPVGANVIDNHLLQDLKTFHIINRAWPLSGKIERELQWTPFAASMGKVEVQETIDDDGTLADFLSQTNLMETSLSIWKPVSLRLLDQTTNSDEDQIQEGSLPEGKDLESLIRKRKLELQDDEHASLEPKRNEAGRGVQGDAVWDLGSLDHFMLTRTESDQASVNPIADSGNEQKTQEVTNKKRHQEQEHLAKERQVNAVKTALRPEIMTPKDRRVFIVSAIFLKDRRRVRQIQEMFPSAEFIERDWSASQYNRSALSAFKQGQSMAESCTISDEADVIMSPSTGLIWTTLQNVKQRALPGQVPRSMIKERVKSIASKYERLVVLISDYHQPDRLDQGYLSNVLDVGDCDDLANFTAFCAGIEDEIEVIFVTGGSMQLSRWIVALMVQHCVSDPGIEFTQEETQWEVFLRRAGMNAFAAQVVLNEFKLTNTESGERSDCGLTAFVKMSNRDRFTRFERILSGGKLISRMNNVFDGRW